MKTFIKNFQFIVLLLLVCLSNHHYSLAKRLLKAIAIRLSMPTCQTTPSAGLETITI